ncbi:hypothetical protein TI04_12600 [Achromatium sp. WMS2]|nr:hypothetical protein TI04_12600 [Achromatium sp. WMS2]
MLKTFNRSLIISGTILSYALAIRIGKFLGSPLIITCCKCLCRILILIGEPTSINLTILNKSNKIKKIMKSSSPIIQDKVNNPKRINKTNSSPMANPNLVSSNLLLVKNN